jgi:hypothetical protein
MSDANPAGGGSNLQTLLHALQQRVISGVGYLDRDVEQRMYEQATVASAQYALSRMTTAFPSRQQNYPGDGHLELLEHALALAQVDGFYAEFGVFKGATLAFIARLIDKVIYGFDSFEGLLESWSATRKKGTFDLGGTIPDVQVSLRNFRMVKGWFRDTLPEFLSHVPGPAAFLHFDCYLYQSAKDVLDALDNRIASGTVIVFRQYFNYPGWQSHQFQAFQEFCERTGATYRYSAFTPTGQSVAVVID